MPGRSVTRVLAAHRHAGEVADVLIGAGELVEERRLAAVLLAGQGERQDRILRERVFVLLGVELSFFAEARMGVVFVQGQIVSEILVQRLCRRLFLHKILVHADLDRLRKPERQGVSVDLDLHRIAHRRHLDEPHFGPGDEAHVQEMLPEGPLSADVLHDGRLAYLQIFQCHRMLPLDVQRYALISKKNIPICGDFRI